MMLDRDTLFTSIWTEVGVILAGTGRADTSDTEEYESDSLQDISEEPDGGLHISRTKDYMKVPPVLYELLSPSGLLLAGRTAALQIRVPLANERLGAEISDQQDINTSQLSAKEKKELFARIGNEYMQMQQLPTDVRVDQLAEYLGFIWRRLLRIWFPKEEWATRLLLDILELSDEINTERAEAQRSGTPTGWFYVAARYLQIHLLQPDDLDQFMERIGLEVLRFLSEQNLKPPKTGHFETAFLNYVTGNLNLDGQMFIPTTQLTDRFQLELEQYVERKATNKVQCSLCSSPYEARQQDKSEVIFKPQQYSNKTRLDTSTVVRGICPICAIEMMLRQVQQGMRAGSAQDEKPVTLFLYPTYFFTAETARVVHDFINQLRDLNLPSLIFSHLGRNGFTLETLAAYDVFVANTAADTTLTQWTLRKPTFSERDPASLFFFTLRPAMSKPTDTDAWIIPLFYALALPLLLDLKIVATSSFVPLYGSGADFYSTTLLDAPHGFTRYIIGRDKFRINELESALWQLLRMYELHLDVFSEPKDLHWGMLNSVAKDIATDPLSVFSYYERKQRKKEEGSQQSKGAKASKSKAKTKPITDTNGSGGIPPYVVDRYLAIYLELGGECGMSFIGQLVDDYAQFYRADYRHLDSAYSVLRPLGTAIEVTKNSNPDTDEEDLVLMIAGTINDELDRVRNDPATSGGYDPIWFDTSQGKPEERLALSMKCIEGFARHFVQLCFKGYCKGERSILRERANRLRSAANFYYLAHHGRTNRQAKNG